MTVVPLPASATLRVRLIYTQDDGSEAGSRFYLGYTGGSATTADLNTLAGDIASAWATNIGPQISSHFSLTEIDILDITTETGNSGLWTGSHAGGNGGGEIPSQVAINVEFDIARRYRGGKPRMYFPPASNAQLADPAHWSDTFVGDFNTAVNGFFSDVTGLSVGSLGVLSHTNLSYYKGFTNVTNSSGRTRAAPKYRDTALVDSITAYSTKKELSSQRRRRTATTP